MPNKFYTSPVYHGIPNEDERLLSHGNAKSSFEKRFKNHLWYLSEELGVFVTFIPKCNMKQKFAFKINERKPHFKEAKPGRRYIS